MDPETPFPGAPAVRTRWHRRTLSREVAPAFPTALACAVCGRTRPPDAMARDSATGDFRCANRRACRAAIRARGHPTGGS